ncbi:MAG: NUDIX hydrolase [Thermanaerothrix sp.]|nr:NUDIX hydrolase [Thermanaerothrix sp.]
MSDSNLSERFLQREMLYEGKIVSVARDEVELPNGRTTFREVAIHRPAVAVLPVLDDGRILLIRQYRHPLKKVIWEIPAGLLEEGEDPVGAAQRELREETGCRVGVLERGPSFFPSPGFCDEEIHIFVGKELVQDPLDCDDDEFVKVHAVTVEAALGMVSSGEILDGKTILAILWFVNSMRDLCITTPPVGD